MYEALKAFGLRIWTGFESFWILIVMMLSVLYYRRAYPFLIIILLLLSITVFTFLLQGDHTRTAAYAFPLFFVAMEVKSGCHTRKGKRIAECIEI